MRKFINTLLLFLIANIAQAQAPQGIPYQAVARNSSGGILASTAISVRFTIRDSVATGTIKYRETHSVTTTAQGMFSVNVGQGTVVSGSFAGINWGTNTKFMQVEMDPAGGASYIDMGTTQMMSVPYTLNSGSVQLKVSATGDTLYSGGGNYVIIPGISAANCIVSAGTITGTATVTVGSTTTLSNAITGGTWSSSATGIATVGSTGVVTGAAPGTATISYSVTNVCGSSVTIKVVTVNASTMPVITTTTVGAIVSCAASSGGTILSDGGFAITARGVVWNTSSGPTITLTTKTNDGTGTGTFISTITGLTASTTYYVRAYATNSTGTSYGTEYSFTTLAGSMCIGSTYAGGIIAYIIQPGDTGYISGEIHGFIAAPSDQGAAQWGCYGTLVGGTFATLGTGAANTAIVSAACGTGTAARICSDLVLNGYSDWYLPSKEELQKLYINSYTIGGFSTWVYSSSTEYSANNCWGANFPSGGWYVTSIKSNTAARVRAIRSF